MQSPDQRFSRPVATSPTIHTSLPMVSQPLAAAVSAVETSGSRGVREWGATGTGTTSMSGRRIKDRFLSLGRLPTGRSVVPQDV